MRRERTHFVHDCDPVSEGFVTEPLGRSLEWNLINPTSHLVQEEYNPFRDLFPFHDVVIVSSCSFCTTTARRPTDLALLTRVFDSFPIYGVAQSLDDGFNVAERLRVCPVWNVLFREDLSRWRNAARVVQEGGKTGW